METTVKNTNYREQTVGDWLQNLLHEHGFTQRDVANETGLSPATINRVIKLNNPVRLTTITVILNLVLRDNRPRYERELETFKILERKKRQKNNKNA